MRILHGHIDLEHIIIIIETQKKEKIFAILQFEEDEFSPSSEHKEPGASSFATKPSCCRQDRRHGRRDKIKSPSLGPRT
jgi:hypothetical protein